MSNSAVTASIDPAILAEQNEAIAHLALADLVMWLRNKIMYEPQYKVEGAPDFILSSENQKALLKTGNSMVQVYLACHLYLTPESQDALIEENDTDIIYLLRTTMGHKVLNPLTPKQFDRMLELASSLNMLVTLGQFSQYVNREYRTKLIEKAEMTGGPSGGSRVANKVISSGRNFSLEEFEHLTSIYPGYEKGSKRALGAGSLPEVTQDHFINHGTLENKVNLAGNPGLNEDRLIALLNFNELEVNNEISRRGKLPVRVLEKITSEGMHLDPRQAEAIISRNGAGIPERFIREALLKVKENGRFLNDEKYITAQSFISDLPADIIFDCLKGAYGEVVKIATYSRKEITQAQIQEITSNYEELSLEVKENLARSGALPIDIRSRMSFEEKLWDALLDHPDVTVDETFNLRFVIRAAGCTGDLAAGLPRFYEGPVASSCRNKINELTQEMGEPLLVLHCKENISIKDGPRRTYEALKN